MHRKFPNTARIGRALITAVLLTMAVGTLSGCLVNAFDPNLNKTTAKWDEEKGEYVSEPNPNYGQVYNNNAGD